MSNPNRLKRLVPVALIAAAASLAVSKGLEGNDSHTYSAKEMREQAVKIADRDTGCYELGGQGGKLKTRTEVVNGAKVNIITIPVHDSSVHKPGTDSWPEKGTNQADNLLDSGFTASYLVAGGKHLDAPIEGVVGVAAGTTPQSTSYNLELGVGTDRSGEWVADISYAADIAVNNQGEYSTLRGSRLCGSVGFNVRPDGVVTGAHVLDPKPEVGKLHVSGGSSLSAPFNSPLDNGNLPARPLQ